MMKVGFEGRYYYPSFHRQKVDPDQRDTYPGINHNALIQYSIKDIDEGPPGKTNQWHPAENC